MKEKILKEFDDKFPYMTVGHDEQDIHDEVRDFLSTAITEAEREAVVDKLKEQIDEYEEHALQSHNESITIEKLIEVNKQALAALGAKEEV
jgi:hypothetical protein